MTRTGRPAARANLFDDRRIRRRTASEVRDPRMGGIIVAHRLDVDRHDLTVSHEIAQRREVQRASAAICPGLDDQLRARLVDDLLVDPEIEWVLERLCPEPRRSDPRIREIQDIVSARDGRAVEAAVETKANGLEGAADVVLHGPRFYGRPSSRSPSASM